MQVFQTRLKLYLLKDIPVTKVQTQITYFLDKGLAQNEKLGEFHRENRFKYYSYDALYPQEEDKIYKKNHIYTLTIRTIDSELADYFSRYIVNIFTDYMKGLTSEVKIIPKKTIDQLYTLTPAVLKDEQGYWRGNMTVDEFEQRLKVNLIKKWNFFRDEKLDEDFELYTGVEFLNKCPVAAEYKGIRLLGDKLRIHISGHPTAQKLAYMSLGTGIMEMNSRGFGFVNYRWL